MKGTHLLLIVRKRSSTLDKSGVLYCLLHIEFHGFDSRIDVLGFAHLGACYLLNFLQIMWVPLLEAFRVFDKEG